MGRINSVRQQVDAVFNATFGYTPSVQVQAPGRVNLIGEHTDYNDGFVLPCAIDFHTVIAAAPRADSLVRVVAVNMEEQQDSFDVAYPIEPHSQYVWPNYIRGVVKYLLARGLTLGGVDMVIGGNVPTGAGLSSSASLEVAVGQVFKTLYALPLSPLALALNGQQAENHFVGCNCGIMDQFISAQGVEGHALLIDCRSLQGKAVPIPLGLDVLIIDSNVQRGLVDSEYNTRRAQCEAAARHFGVKALRDVSLAQFAANRVGLDPVVAQRARHILTENQRTLQAVEALTTGDIPRLSRLMAQSHRSMRDDFAITVPPIDILVALIHDYIGERGGVRMTGGGFGGCVVALLPASLTAEVCERVAREYPALTGLPPTLYVCQPSAGAGMLPESRQ